jgi:hypothetical protein
MTNCAVPTCEKENRRRSPYCYAHYMKNWRYGTPNPTHPKFRKDLTGLSVGKLTVTSHHSPGKWICECKCGKQVIKSTSELNRCVVKGWKITCGSTDCRRMEIVCYSSAHDRVRRDRGAATIYSCVDCGAQAQQWSYCHLDPNELLSKEEASFGLPYSCDPSQYAPRCVPCHKRFDIDRLGGKIARKSKA